MPELPAARTRAERLFYERLQQLSAERRAIVLRAVGDPPDFDRLPLPIVLKLIEDQKFDAWKFYVLIYILAFTGMRREYGGLTEPLPDLADEDHFGPPPRLGRPPAPCSLVAAQQSLAAKPSLCPSDLSATWIVNPPARSVAEFAHWLF